MSPRISRRHVLRLMSTGAASLAAAGVAARNIVDPFHLLEASRVRAYPGAVAAGDVFGDFVILPFGAAAAELTTPRCSESAPDEGSGPLDRMR